jgi:hypothetical protein
VRTHSSSRIAIVRVSSVPEQTILTMYVGAAAVGAVTGTSVGAVGADTGAGTDTGTAGTDTGTAGTDTGAGTAGMAGIDSEIFRRGERRDIVASYIATRIRPMFSIFMPIAFQTIVKYDCLNLYKNTVKTQRSACLFRHQ